MSELFNYVMNTPGNTNPAVLSSEIQKMNDSNPMQTKTIVDTNNYFSEKTVEGALDQIGGQLSSKELILDSSTAESTKKFKITVDDTGTLTATEINET